MDRAHHVRLDERGRTVDRAVDMALGGEMHHGIDSVRSHSLAHRPFIANIRSGMNV